MRLRILFLIKLLLRRSIFVILLIFYFWNRDLLDFTVKPVFWPMYVIWGMVLLELLLRFIPGKFHPTGMQKHLKRNFVPTKHYLEEGITEKDRKELKKLDWMGFRVFIAYLLLNAIWFTLYFLHIWGVPELVMIMSLYYFGDMICANGFCPFKLFLMGNRCCNVCRIYNWDAIMGVIPLIVIIHPMSMSLVVVAVIYTGFWELRFRTHPEYFLESCNQTIGCKSCRGAICPIKRKKFFQKIVKEVFKKDPET